MPNVKDCRDSMKTTYHLRSVEVFDMQTSIDQSLMSIHHRYVSPHTRSLDSERLTRHRLEYALAKSMGRCGRTGSGTCLVTAGFKAGSTTFSSTFGVGGRGSGRTVDGCSCFLSLSTFLSRREFERNQIKILENLPTTTILTQARNPFLHKRI